MIASPHVMSDPAEESKLIIDEDWKAQAQAEKERLQAEQEAKRAAESPAAAAPDAQAEADDDRELPPPTLPVLMSTLATQAMVCLGQVPNPMTGKAEVRLREAKHFIDTLAMLEDKTANNRTPEENAMLLHLLHELRLTYITTRP